MPPARPSRADTVSSPAADARVRPSEPRTYAHPRLWRRLSAPLIAAMHAGRAPRPPMPVEVRRELLEPLLPDSALLEELTGESFTDWRRDTGRGSFTARARSAEPAR
jgi:hypothetical protein